MKKPTKRQIHRLESMLRSMEKDEADWMASFGEAIKGTQRAAKIEDMDVLRTVIAILKEYQGVTC